MFGNIYGLDLGTYEIKVFDKKQDKICRERDVIAIKIKKIFLRSVTKHMKCTRRLLMISKLSFR